MKNIYEVESANKRKSFLVMFFFVVFIVLTVYVLVQALGYGTGSLGFVGLALIISGLMSLGSYYFSDRIVLSISRARPASRERDFKFYTVAENLALAAGLPKPRLYVINDSAPNAFATGRSPQHAVVCATTGLLNKLSRTELEGVIAHELSHIKNYDTRLLSIVAVLVGMVALLADWFLRMQWYGNRRRDDSEKTGAIFLVLGIIFAMLSPIIANLIKLAVSRRREFMADAGAVAITRQPNGLMSALKKIAADHEPLEVANKATAHLYISNPFKDKRKDAVSRFANLFNTHPPIGERLKVLEKMS